MANKKLTPLEILYREFKNAKTDAARNDAWRRFEVKRGEMYPARTDRRSAMLRDSAAVAAKYPTKVLGGENHRYYEPGQKKKIGINETAKRSPEIFIDPQSGERFVRAFHYTQPENIDNILKTGLAARIGPDSRYFQNRAGVWASFGNANPMPYDYVNEAALGEKAYSMEPLEIRVPEEEWKAMPIDHTGKTVNDQVMVFRPSDAQPYGTVDVAGEKAPVVIPPEYISRYEFPKDWETEAKYGNKTLWGYRPTKKEIIVDDEGFVNSVSPNLLDRAKTAIGKKASSNELAQWLVDNAQDELKTDILEHNSSIGYGGLGNREFWGTKYSAKDKTNADRDLIYAKNLKPDAKRSWFTGTRFESPYDFAYATETPPKPSEGSVYRGSNMNAQTWLLGIDVPRTKKIVTDIAGDKTSIGNLVKDPYEMERQYYMLTNKINESPGIELPYQARNPLVQDYLKSAGVRLGIGEYKTSNQTRQAFNGYKDLNGGISYTRDDLRKANAYWKNDFYRKGGYKEKVDNLLSSGNAEDAKKAKEIIEQYRMDLMSPSVRKRRQQYVLGLNKVPYSYEHYESHKTEPAAVAKAMALSRAMRSDELNNALSQETDLYLKQHPELDFDKDYDEAFFAVKKKVGEPYAQAIAESYYPEELQKVRQKLVEDWKKQFSNDSLNRVFGHELGCKVGKYRASRGKPVNPKQL